MSVTKMAIIRSVVVVGLNSGVPFPLSLSLSLAGEPRSVARARDESVPRAVCHYVAWRGGEKYCGNFVHCPHWHSLAQQFKG